MTRIKKTFPSKRRLLYAILSVGCPFATLGGALVYQSFAHATFWKSLTPDESAAGALMGFAEIMQLLLVSVVGCLVGLGLALISLLPQPRKTGVSLLGYIGLAVNGLPLLLLALSWLIGSAIGH